MLVVILLVCCAFGFGQLFVLCFGSLFSGVCSGFGFLDFAGFLVWVALGFRLGVLYFVCCSFGLVRYYWFGLVFCFKFRTWLLLEFYGCFGVLGFYLLVALVFRLFGC